MADDQHLPLSDRFRREVFRALVEVQDGGVPVGTSRSVVARRFGLSEDVVRAVEREGLAGQWPPLGDEAAG